MENIISMKGPEYAAAITTENGNTDVIDSDRESDKGSSYAKILTRSKTSSADSSVSSGKQKDITVSAEVNTHIYQLLAISCKDTALRKVKSVGRGKGVEAWHVLKEAYASSRPERVSKLTVELMNRLWESDDNIELFRNDFERILQQLKDCGQEFDVQVARTMILQRIPSKRFGPMIAKLMSEKGTVAELFESLKIYDATAKDSDDEVVDTLAKSFLANNVKKMGKKPSRKVEREVDNTSSESDEEEINDRKNGSRTANIKCYFCHHIGHKESECKIKRAMSQELKEKAEKKYGEEKTGRSKTLFANFVDVLEDDRDAQAF